MQPMAETAPNPSRNRRAWSPRWSLTVAVGDLAARRSANWDLGLLRGPARLLDLQRPDRGLDRVQGQGLRQLPGAGPGDGLPRRHAGGADRRRHDPRRLARAGATTGTTCSTTCSTYALFPLVGGHRLPRGRRGDRASPHRDPILLPARLRPLPVRPGDQLRDDRRLRLLRRARPLREQAARCCRRCCPPSSRARCWPSRVAFIYHRSASPAIALFGVVLITFQYLLGAAAALPAAGRASWSGAASSWPASRSGC